MLFIKGKLQRIFTGTDFVKEDGTVVPGKVKLQLLVERTLKNGEVKYELIDISIQNEKRSLYKDKVDSDVEVEIGVIGKCSFYGM